MRPTWILVALCALSSSVLIAQSEVTTTKERIRREVAEKQRLMREGKLVRNNVRVTVRLANGSRLRGVVKNGKFIERHDGLAFVQADRATEGSGLRIWYYDQTNSYIFLPWNTIIDHTIGEVLSDKEVAEMGLELDRLAKAARERSGKSDGGQQSGDEKTGGLPGATPGPGGAVKPPDKTTTKSALTDEQKALLAEFPPEAGWGLDKLKQIEARKIRIGVYPNEKEQSFLDNFSAWNEAYELQEAEKARQAGGIGNGPGGRPGVVTTEPSKGPGQKGGRGSGTEPPKR